MKTIYRIILALSVLLASVACGEKNEGPAVSEKIVAEWHLISVSGMTSAPQVYVDFSQDLSFELYQKIGEGAFRLYRGSWNIDGDVLAGKYNDGEEWGTRYQISIDGKTLTMKYSIHDSEVTSVYTSVVIPSEVKIGCEVVVKSEGAGF